MQRPVHTPEAPVRLELPNGDRYHLHPRLADLEGYLAPERAPHLEPGITPVKVHVTRAGAVYTVTLAPGELETLLQHARRETAELTELPLAPLQPHDPTRGRGQRDPEARRLGPNVESAPDPGHRGTHRQRRKSRKG
jgi:hypothetical protein